MRGLQPMPKYVNVQLQGVAAPIRIKGDQIKKDTGADYEITKGQEVVAKFRESAVMGWWIDGE
jgi:hypothetical protein